MGSQRILVTGASGFTGRHFIRNATAAGYQCLALCQHEGAQLLDVEKIYTGDLSDRSAINDLLSVARPDYVVHLAAVAYVADGNMKNMYLSNVVGTANLLDALNRCALPVKKILLASSGNVYGNATDLPISEQHPPVPVNDYGVSKYAMELAVRIHMKDLPVIILRPFNYTGKGQSENFLIPKIVAAFKRRDKTIELGNLDVARDFSDVRDVVQAYLKLLESPVRSGIFNVCSGHSIFLHEVLRKLSEIAAYDIDVNVGHQLVRENEIKVLYGTEDKLRNIIGEYRRYSFDETLHWMYQEYW